MVGRIPRLVLALALLLAVLLTASCSSQPEPLNDDILEERAQLYMRELRDNILPYRNRTNSLYEMGLLINSDTVSVGVEYLGRFYDSYQAGEPAVLDIVYVSESVQVFSRLDYLGDSGYYFRYELEEEEAIAVTNKTFDRLEITSNQNSNRLNLKMYNGKQEVATLSFLPSQE